MTNDRDITRYEINEHGELPLSYGRYVRWEDYDNHLQWLLGRIEKLEQKVLESQEYYSEGYEDGWDDGIRQGREDME